MASTSHAALYSSGDDVVQLNATTFKSRVLDSGDVWLVEFYVQWCGYCRDLAPEWKKAAKALNGVVHVGAVDMDQHASVGVPYRIQRYPTIKVFGANKQSPTDYVGGRTAPNIVDEAVSQVRAMVRERLGGGGGGGSSSSSFKPTGPSGGGGGGGDAAKDVVQLTDRNFKELVLDSQDLWLVEFFAPWCRFCQMLAPEWAKAATELKGKVKLGAVDATVYGLLAQRYGVRGYPTIKYFGANKQQAAEEYNGGRSSSDIVTWSNNKFSARTTRYTTLSTTLSPSL